MISTGSPNRPLLWEVLRLFQEVEKFEVLTTNVQEVVTTMKVSEGFARTDALGGRNLSKTTALCWLPSQVTVTVVTAIAIDLVSKQ